MKKFIITVIALCISAITFAQNPIEKNVGDFTEVKVYDRIVVNLVKSDENKVIISGEDASQVNIVNKDGKLKIKMDLGLIFDGNRTFVHVYYSDLQIIAETAEVFVQAGGEVEAYATKLADLTIRAGGDIDIYGNPAEVKRKRTFGGRIRIM